MKKVIGLTAICLLVLLFLPALATAQANSFTQEEQVLLSAYESGDIIRLHILADSDDTEAQRIKLAVRDAVLKAFGNELTAAADASCTQVYALLASQAEEMRCVAEECAKAEGFTGSVSAEVGRMTLPAKDYGHITLPSGEYQALRITLGSGEGQNWWCVLFPQLCLAAASDEPWQTPVTADDASSASITPSEPEIIWDTKQILNLWSLF
ncbi:MAG: stage II sporulation protein R [Clostridiales bacterium]|nr:stage II sporulation protein R [Clostridiales bacterium]